MRSSANTGSSEEREDPAGHVLAPMAESKPSGPAAYVSTIPAGVVVRAHVLPTVPRDAYRAGGNNRERFMLLVRGPVGDFIVLT